MNQIATREDVAWAAGFFDGEGSVFLASNGKKNPSLNLVATVGQADPRPLVKLRDWFEGSLIGPHSNHCASGAKCRPRFIWTLKGEAAERFLIVVLPRLVVKADVVRVALESRKIPKESEERKSLLADFKGRISRMNNERDYSEFYALVGRN